MFNSPCSFYRHKCNQLAPKWCLFCDLYNEGKNLQIGSASSVTSEEGREGLQDVVNLCRQESESSGLPNDSKENEEPLIIQEAANSVKNVPESETKISFKIELSPIRETTKNFRIHDEVKSELSELSENSQNFDATNIIFKEVSSESYDSFKEVKSESYDSFKEVSSKSYDSFKEVKSESYDSLQEVKSESYDIFKEVKSESYEIDFKDFYVCTDCDPYR